MILVTGGTGLVGSHLLLALLKENKKVRAIHRKNSDLQAVEELFALISENAQDYYSSIDWVEADLTNIPALTEAFEGVTEVYHAAAYVSFDPGNYRKLKKSNVEGTSNIVNLCLTHNVKKLCHVSSIATLGTKSNGELATEETEWNPEENNNVYAITKYGAELEVWRASQEGLEVVIVQPGVILGEGDRSSGSGQLLQQVKKGISNYTTGGAGVVDVKDVVRAMTQLMSSEIHSQNYILVGQNLTYKDLITRFSTAMRSKPPKKSIPKWVLSFASKLDWVGAKIFGLKRRLPKAMVSSLFEVSYYSSEKIEKELDFAFTPLDQTLERISKSYSTES